MYSDIIFYTIKLVILFMSISISKKGAVYKLVVTRSHIAVVLLCVLHGTLQAIMSYVNSCLAMQDYSISL